MGQVYRATDEKLRREVAIKILPGAFTEDPERLARFEREAQLLAQLQHPNIASIYGVEESEGVRGLIMELVEGQTLGERLEQGALPVEDAVSIALQIVDALEEAHEKGIIHRDLKPLNVKLTPDGKVKVLDFGLAKAMEAKGVLSGSGAGPADLTVSPTLTFGETAHGVILGTAAYMAPEQAKGLAVDKRVDIWAFGVVLYEMLTGKRLIEGDSVAEILGSLFRQEIALGEIPEATPPAVRRLLQRCLARDPRERLRDIGDARLELESTEVEAVTGRERAPRPRRWLHLLTFAAGAGLVALGFWWSLRSSEPPAQPATRFALRDIGMPIDSFQGLAISPDGRRLVYRARDEDDEELLYLRSFDDFEAKPLPGTEFGWLPSFSPDGERIVFLGSGHLRTVGVAGGSARSIANLGAGFSGGAWLPDGYIVYAPAAGRKLYKIHSSGGEVEELEIVPSQEGDLVTSPWALPDGRALLVSWGGGPNFDVALYDLEDKSIKVLAENGFTPIYVETGHILYQEGVDGSLMALPFDAETRTLRGNAFPVVDDLGSRVSYQVRMFAVGGSTLAYVPRSSYLDSRALVWVDRQGDATPIVEIDSTLDMPRLSHDGLRVAFRTPAPTCDVWVHHLEHGATTRVTFEGDNHGTAWSPDDERIAVARNETSLWGVFSVAADGAGSIERLSSPESPRAMVSSYSSDGRYLLIASQRESTGGDIDLVEVESQSATPLLQSRFHEEAGSFSPDGRRIAYVSNESGRAEVYVQSFPDLDHRRQVSTQGGEEPVWSALGDELFFRSGKKMMVVSMGQEDPFVVSAPEHLFDTPTITVSGFGMPSYDVSSDGQRFIMVRQRSGPKGAEIHLVEGWLGELKSLAGRASAR